MVYNRIIKEYKLENAMRIRDVEQLTGLSRKTIRFYEAKGLLNVGRSDNSYREYDEDMVEQLRRIAVLRRAGISLGDIQLWQDSVITTSEMLHKRLHELRSAADIAMDQVKLCSDLLESMDTQRYRLDGFEDESDLPEREPVLPCIGIDIGTTTISAVVLDPAAGESAGVYTLPNDSNLESGNLWEKQQDPDKIIERIDRLMESLLRRYPGVKCIGITGQMHGIVYVNADGCAVSPLYTWQDERAGQGNPSSCRLLFEKTGYTVSPGYGLATHFDEQRNGKVPADAVKICTIMDYVVMHLCGNKSPVTHSSNAASFGLYRTDENRFDTDAVGKAGMDPRILPDVTDGCEIVGTFRGIPVAAAIGDNQASFMGSVRNPLESALANFGTGSQISMLGGGTYSDSAIEIRPFMEGRRLLSGSALCGGRAYALMERFFRAYVTACGMAVSEQYDVMNTLARRGIESGRILDMRTTFCGTRNDPTLRGSICGISEDNLTPEAMIAGTLYGMARELYGMFEKMPHEHVRTLITSGNAVRKNPALRMMLEQVFGMEIRVPVHREEAAFGAAMFSAMASGCVTDMETLTACIRYEENQQY